MSSNSVPRDENRPLSTLGELRAFVSVAETGSFSQAAQILGLSQPTVSQRVRSLETTYGLRLLERRHGIALTSAGREIFNRARLLISRADELDVLARDLVELRQGHLKVGYSTPSFALSIIAWLLDHHPGLKIDQSLGNTSELIETLHRCEIDAAVLTLDTPPDDLRTHLIAPQALLICVPARHPLSKRDSVTLEEVASERIILRERGSLTRALFETSCDQAGLHPERIMPVPSRESVKEAVVAGLGLGVILDGEIGSDRRMRGIPLADALTTGGVYGVSLPEVTGLPAVEAFFAGCEAVSTKMAAARDGR